MAIADEKDRFGELLREAEKGREDQFFAERDRELLLKLRQKQQAEAEATANASAQDRCPKCGELLHWRDDAGIEVAECRTCGTSAAIPTRADGARSAKR